MSDTNVPSTAPPDTEFYPSLGAHFERVHNISIGFSINEISEHLPSQLSLALRPGASGVALTQKKEQPQDPWVDAPQNPRNWPARQKWIAVLIIAMYSFIAPFGSTAMAPALPQIGDHYHIANPTILAMTLSIFLLSFAFGPLILAPVSEIYGRNCVYHTSNLLFVAFNIGCALAPNTGSLIAFRVLCGFVGSGPNSIGGGSIGDLFAERDRASAMAVYTMGTLLGPILGPVCGGWIAQTVGFKYIFYVIFAFGALASLVAIPFLRETYHPVIRRRLARQLGDIELAGGAAPPENTAEYIWLNLCRPFVLLTQSVVCFMLGTYLAFMYGIYYLMFTTYPALFVGYYKFSTGASGLVYLGLGVGFVLSSVVVAVVADGIYRSLSQRLNNGVGKPEYRLPPLILGSFVVPIALLWYGWSAKTHWIMPIIGSAIFGFAVMFAYLPVQLYLVDTFTYAASAVGAATVLRCLSGFAFPLFGAQMYDRLGYGGGNSLLAGLAVVLGIPFPLALWFFGERIRARSALARR